MNLMSSARTLSIEVPKSHAYHQDQGTATSSVFQIHLQVLLTSASDNRGSVCRPTVDFSRTFKWNLLLQMQLLSLSVIIT